MLPGVHFSEFLIICVVALVVIGPRDLPKLARTVAGYVRKARGLAKDFQRSFDEMGRQLELDELRREVQALRHGEPISDVTRELKAFERDLKAVDHSTRAELTRRPAIAGPSPASKPSPTPSSAQAPAAAPASAVPTHPAAPKIEAPEVEEGAPEGPRQEDQKLGGAA